MCRAWRAYGGETTTLVPTIEKVLARYPIRRVVLVADRGLLSLDNVEAIRGLPVGGEPLEFLLAVPAQRYGEFDTLLAAFHEQHCRSATTEVFGEQQWQECRLIVAHRPDTAAEQGRLRGERIAALEADAARWARKRDAQEAGRTAPGKKLTHPRGDGPFLPGGRRHASRAHPQGRSVVGRVRRRGRRARPAARPADGWQADPGFQRAGGAPAGIVTRYKTLADIERGFRVLKSESEIAPVFHRLPDRIRAHALICFLALLLYRVLRLRLKARGSPISPERALEIARRIQYHQVTLQQRQPASDLSVVTPQQKELFETTNRRV